MSPLLGLRAKLTIGTTVVIVVRVDSRFDCDAATLWLNAEDQDRAARFRFQRDRANFVAAHALLGVAVQAALGIGPTAWRLVAPAPGAKPALCMPATVPLFANLSHTQGWAVVALSATVEVGVDIEAIRPLPDLLMVAERVMTQREQLAIAQAPVTQDLFYRLWTRKEAVLKAFGIGLTALDPRTVDVLSLAGPRLPVELNEPVTLHEFLEPGHVMGAACSRGQHTPFRLIELPVECLATSPRAARSVLSGSATGC